MIDLKKIRAVEDEFVADGIAASVVIARVARIVEACKPVLDAQELQKKASDKRVRERAARTVPDFGAVAEIKRGLV